MVYNTPHSTRAYTRKLNRRNATLRPPVRTLGTRRKGIYHTVRRNTTLPVNNTRRVKTLHNETRQRKLSKDKVKLWGYVFEEINELTENTGLLINENGELKSDDGEEISVAQFRQLIKELEEGLDSALSDEDEGEIGIFTKAIRFVKKERRKARRHNVEMNSLGEMMSRTRV